MFRNDMLLLCYGAMTCYYFAWLPRKNAIVWCKLYAE